MRSPHIISRPSVRTCKHTILVALYMCLTGLAKYSHQETIHDVEMSMFEKIPESHRSKPDHRDADLVTSYNIPVNIQFKPAHYLHDRNFIATNVNFSAKAEILDEKFKNIQIEYQWSVKNKTIITNSNASEIVYHFTEADEDEILQLLVFHQPNDTGLIKKNLVIRDPITVLDPKGKLFLEHGELLDITLNFSTGTGPINYCRKFCRDVSLHKEDEHCSECVPDSRALGNQVSIIEYIRNVGNYTLLFVADNIASHIFKSYSVKITDTVRPRTLPFVPIVSSILAVVIVLSGLALHMKCKRTYATETADFDFIRHDYNEEEDFWDDEEYTFFQRVRYLFFPSERDPDTSVTDSYLGGLSSRI